MAEKILLVAALEGAEHCARALEEQVGLEVELASTRQSALEALERSSYLLLVIEEHLAESDPAWADRVWQLAGTAVPLQINLVLSGGTRLVREARAALSRRGNEQAIARRAALLDINRELNAAVTGLLLESELALRSTDLPATLEPRLRHMAELAGDLSVRLRASQQHAR